MFSLTHFFDSKKEFSVFSFFLSHSEESFSKEEIFAFFKYDIKTIHILLKGLEKKCLIEKNPKSLYQLSIPTDIVVHLKEVWKSSHLYEKPFFLKTVRAVFKLSLFLLENSYDTDARVHAVFVTKDLSNMNQKKIHRAVESLSRYMGYRMNPLILDKEEYLYRISMSDVTLRNFIVQKPLILLDIDSLADELHRLF